MNRVCKRYGKTVVLRDVSMRVGPSETVAVVGRNGSGKSTLLSMISGVLKPDGGAVLFNGKNVLSEKRLPIGFVPQGDNLFEQLTVWDNLKFWGSVSGVRLRRPEDCRFAALLDVASFARKRVSACSGGMRRRAAICAALAGDPDLLVLDEPFTGLDLFYKSELLSCLKTLAGIGKSIIYTTHSGEELGGLCDRIYVIGNRAIAKEINMSAVSETDRRDMGRLLLNYIGEDNGLES